MEPVRRRTGMMFEGSRRLLGVGMRGWDGEKRVE
jgi:hypothetical protein